MSTELRNVPETNITQTRFYGGADRGVCIQISQVTPNAPRYTSESRSFDYIQLTKEQARNLAVELMMFAEGREVEEFEDCGGDERHNELAN